MTAGLTLRPEDARMLRQIRRALANLCSTP